jgi:Flp pilus assembly protein TadB
VSQRTLSASEISDFTFCRRAWWYARQGETSQNQKRIQSGEEWHRAQARRVLAAGCLRTAGYAILVAAAVLAATALTAGLLR